MSSQSILKLLIVASIFTVYCEALSRVVVLNESSVQIIEEAKASKHPRCFTSYQVDCDHTNYPGYDFDMERWYYSAVYKVCTPVFLDRGDNKLCPGIIDWIVDLPYTKKECEDLCGEPCTIVHRDLKTEPGICMMDCGIVVPKDIQLPCLPSHFGCCPRDYVPPFTPAMDPYVEPEPTFFDPVKDLVLHMKSQISKIQVTGDDFL